MTRALFALLLTGCLQGGGLDGTWCDGHDVATCCVAYTFGPGDAFEEDDCHADDVTGTYATDGGAMHVITNEWTRDLRWDISTGLVLRHGLPGVEETLRLEMGEWHVVLGRQ